jgi:tetratricopeptide (TPR) repeat protein
MWFSGLIFADAVFWTHKDGVRRAVTELFEDADRKTAHSDGTRDASDNRAADWNPSLPRLWRRLSARLLDLAILSIPAAVLLQSLPAAWGIKAALPLTYVSVLVLESILLSRLGFTPAKWLLGISVRDESGLNLSSSKATARTASVMWRSAIVLFPITAFLAFRCLKRTGTTKWDRRAGANVRYTPLKPIRAIMAVGIAAALLCVATLELWLAEKASSAPKALPSPVVAGREAEPKEQEPGHWYDVASAALREDRILDGIEAGKKGALLEIPRLREAIKRDPFNVTLRDSLGETCRDAQEPEQGVEAFLQVTRLAPSNPDGWRWLGLLQSDARNVAGAEAAIRKALELSPTVENWNSLGYVLEKGERLRDAIDAYSGTLKIDPNNIEALQSCAQNCERLGYWDTAASIYQKLLRINPSDDVSRVRLSQALKSRGKLNDAR